MKMLQNSLVLCAMLLHRSETPSRRFKQVTFVLHRNLWDVLSREPL